MLPRQRWRAVSDCCAWYVVGTAPSFIAPHLPCGDFAAEHVPSLQHDWDVARVAQVLGCGQARQARTGDNDAQRALRPRGCLELCNDVHGQRPSTWHHQMAVGAGENLRYCCGLSDAVRAWYHEHATVSDSRRQMASPLPQAHLPTAPQRPETQRCCPALAAGSRRTAPKGTTDHAISHANSIKGRFLKCKSAGRDSGVSRGPVNRLACSADRPDASHRPLLAHLNGCRCVRQCGLMLCVLQCRCTWAVLVPPAAATGAVRLMLTSL